MTHENFGQKFDFHVDANIFFLLRTENVFENRKILELIALTKIRRTVLVVNGNGNNDNDDDDVATDDRDGYKNTF